MRWQTTRTRLMALAAMLLVSGGVVVGSGGQIKAKSLPVKGDDGRAADELLLPVSFFPPPQFHMVKMEVTAYCSCKKCCGPNARGITASGKRVTYDGGQFVAADLPFGTLLEIPGYAGGKPVEVIDRGGAIKGNRLDVFFPTHQQAKTWGRRWVEVRVLDRVIK